MGKERIITLTAENGLPNSVRMTMREELLGLIYAGDVDAYLRAAIDFVQQLTKGTIA